MIYVEYDETNDKAKLQVDGCLGQIWAELGLVIKKISTSEGVDMTVEEICDAIRESIDYNIKNCKTEIVS